MKRKDQHKLNQRIVNLIIKWPRHGQWVTPSYQSVVCMLNREGLTSSWGNTWTSRSLYRMLQREGYNGLHGLFKSDHKWKFITFLPPELRPSQKL